MNVSKTAKYKRKNKDKDDDHKRVYKKPTKKATCRTQIIRPPLPRTKEIKVFDKDSMLNVLLPTNSNQNGYFLNGMQRGAGSYNRIGDYIRIKRIQYKIRNLRVDAVSPLTQSTCITNTLVWDGMNQTNLTSSNGVWRGIDQTGNYVSSYLSYPNPSNFDRFKIIAEHRYITPTFNVFNGAYAAMVPNEPNESFWEGDIECDLPVKFYTNQSSGDVGDVQSGSISFFPRCPGNDIAVWNAQIVIRFTFIDE